MGGIVQRLAQGADQGLVLVEQRVEEAHQFVELVRGVAHGHPGIQLAGANNGAGSRDNLPHGPHGAVRKEGPGQETEQDGEAAGEKEAAADGV